MLANLFVFELWYPDSQRMSYIVQIKDGQPNWGLVLVCETLGFLSFFAAFLVITKSTHSSLQIPIPLWTNLRMQSGGRQTPVNLMAAWLQRPTGMHAMMALQWRSLSNKSQQHIASNGFPQKKIEVIFPWCPMYPKRFIFEVLEVFRHFEIG